MQHLVNRKLFGHRFNDLTDQRFGLLKVVTFAGFKGASAAWNCRCPCGKETVIMSRRTDRRAMISRVSLQCGRG